MFQHLKLKEIKIIKEAKLLNLGKINIICGKNNSGKTTLLKGIQSEKIIGKTLRKEELTYLKELPEIWTPKGRSSQNSVTDSELDSESGFKNFEKKYFTILEKLILKKNLWFADESETFRKELETVAIKVLKKNLFEKVDINPRRVFTEEIWNDSKIILIPPKRNLESDCNYNRQKFKPDGTSLVSELYWLKNQPRNSDEYKFYGKLCMAFKAVSSNHGFNITREENDKLLLRFASAELDEINADDCGLGLQDLLVILYFAVISKYEIVLIEEPENHIHPEMQRKLLKFLKEETDKQYFITTHSNIFLNSTYVDRVFFTKFEDGEIKVSDETKQAEILQDIGYSIAENLVSDLIILVEGPTDTPIVEELLSKFGIDAKYNIKTWALGGDIMDKHNLSVFAEKYKVIALIDRDPKSDDSRKIFEKNCKALNIPVTRLKRYAIENYFSVRVLREVFKGQISDNLEEIDPNTKLFDQIGMDVKNNNRKLAKAMTKDEIKGTDLEGFFNEVEKILVKL